MKNSLKIKIFDPIESPLNDVFVENAAKLAMPDSSDYDEKIEAAYPYYGESSTITHLQGKARFNSQASADPRQGLWKTQSKDKPLSDEAKILMKLKERELKKRILLKRTGKKQESSFEFDHHILQSPV